jgi:hypothetical protein
MECLIKRIGNSGKINEFQKDGIYQIYSGKVSEFKKTKNQLHGKKLSLNES